MSASPAVVFDRLRAARPPERPGALFGTACVLGGSVAGLAAARVLADYAERVIIVDPDDVAEPEARASVPQRRHLHVLLPAGLDWTDRWFPGFSREMRDAGAVLPSPEQTAIYQDDQPRARSGANQRLLASRPFLEARMRDRVLGLGNVRMLRGRATGLSYRGDEVCGVRYQADGASRMLPAEFVADATGRASSLADWLAADGFDRPALRRLPAAINYTTALFKRAERPEDLPLTSSAARFSPSYPVHGVAGAAVGAIESDRWVLTLMAYDDVRPGRTVSALRAVCAKMPPLYAEVAAQDLAGEITTYRQAESRRRDFTGAKHLPARLVSVGDAVASFNPIFGQGMSSAMLHASCLSEYLSTAPGLHGPAARFFELQRVVTDAAWEISAGADAARLDARSGIEVPEDVRRQRRAMDHLMRAALVDADVCQVVESVTDMVAHPSVLADPALLEQVDSVLRSRHSFRKDT
jgi:2-polyprenyl-6-methoxyphenol hydroxylase-like FAD-dependent oxidoreductase